MVRIVFVELSRSRSSKNQRHGDHYFMRMQLASFGQGSIVTCIWTGDLEAWLDDGVEVWCSSKVAEANRRMQPASAYNHHYILDSKNLVSCRISIPHWLSAFAIDKYPKLLKSNLNYWSIVYQKIEKEMIERDRMLDEVPNQNTCTPNPGSTEVIWGFQRIWAIHS
ncbi:hypothetical protein M408DRAFT_11726 [Serendipita vermifera MAFF 305830]|uniref:Uncharacterized protein n=1 Tax=Serendipita vermifera MAFF 305830 TaxID=933852 RepID=A0A0C3AEL6_SERVB|nr:hypothetical protein M408DRAFT_11726 [Serendipita vermifera MAFF 305830]